jgi:hypothetical protein
MKLCTIILSLLGWAAFTFLAVPTPKAAAHGGGALQFGNVPAGPYLLTVWLAPPEVVAGNEFHVTVGVTRASQSNSQPVLDATVLVELFPGGVDQPRLSAAATTEGSTNKLLYEADLRVREPGSYMVLLTVSGTDGVGSAEFELVIGSARRNEWLSWTPVMLGVVMAWVLWRRSRHVSTSAPGKSGSPRTIR